MSFVGQFAGEMNDTVVVTNLASLSTDGYGTPVYSGASTYEGRLVREQKLVRTLEGTEDVSTHTLWIGSTSTFANALSRRFAVNGTNMGPLMALEAFPDENGVAFLKLYFG